MARRTLLSVSFALALTLVEFGTARADWLDDAWGEDRVEMTGNPAITIYGDTIDIVLPTATLYRAYEEGLTTQDILDVFLDRYGQRCSGMVDLNMCVPAGVTATQGPLRPRFRARCSSRRPSSDAGEWRLTLAPWHPVSNNTIAS